MKKRNRLLIITAALFVVTALVFLILGFALSGADVIGWFKSKYAMMFYAVFVVYIIVIFSVLANDWIRRI